MRICWSVLGTVLLASVAGCGSSDESVGASPSVGGSGGGGGDAAPEDGSTNDASVGGAGGASVGGGGNGGAAGEAGVDAAAESCAPTTCVASKAECGTIEDGCGQTLSCGECKAPEQCGLVSPNQCDCEAEDDTTLCTQGKHYCGQPVIKDACGVERHPDCGSCQPPLTCGGGAEPEVCGCTPETDGELCASLSANCGAPSISDKCGAARTPDCGTCVGYKSCTAGKCTCAFPGEVTVGTCNQSQGSVVVSSPTSLPPYYTYSPTQPPPACTMATAQTYHDNTILLNWPANPGECGYYRFCSYDSGCATDYSPGVVMMVCIQANYWRQCTMM